MRHKWQAFWSEFTDHWLSWLGPTIFVYLILFAVFVWE